MRFAALAVLIGAGSAGAQGFERPVSYSHENSWAATFALGGTLSTAFDAAGSRAYGGPFVEAGVGAAFGERGELSLRVRGGGVLGPGGGAAWVAALAGYRIHAGEEWKTHFAVDLYGPLLPDPGVGVRAAVGAMWDRPAWGVYAETGIAAALGPRVVAAADVVFGVQIRWSR